MTKSTVVDMVHRLERAGMIERAMRTNADRRQIPLKITQKGELALSHMPSTIDANSGFVKAIENLTDEERETLHQLLHKVITSLGIPAPAYITEPSKRIKQKQQH